MKPMTIGTRLYRLETQVRDHLDEVLHPCLQLTQQDSKIEEMCGLLKTLIGHHQQQSAAEQEEKEEEQITDRPEAE